MGLILDIKARWTQAQQALKGLQGSVKSVSGSIKGAIGALGVGFGVSKAIDGFKSVVNSLDEIGKKSDRLGVTTDFMQKLEYAAGRNGVQAEKVENAFQKMRKAIGDAANGNAEALKKFERIGISIADIKGLSAEEQFRIIAGAIRGIGDESEQTAAAMRIFEEGGAKLLTFFRNYEQLGAELQSRGGIIAEADIRAAEAYNDALLNIQKSFVRIMAQTGVIKGLSDAMQGAADLASGNTAKQGRTVSREQMLNDAFAQIPSRQKPAYYETLRLLMNNSEMAVPAEWREFLKQAGYGGAITANGRLADVYAPAPTAAEVQKASAERAQRIESRETAAASAKRAAEEASANSHKEGLAALEAELRAAQMIAAGRERELVVEKALNDFKKKNADATEEELRKVAELAGATYDIKHPKAGNISATASNPENVGTINNALTAIGANGGIVRRNDFQKEIADSVKKIGDDVQIIRNNRSGMYFA